MAAIPCHCCIQNAWVFQRKLQACLTIGDQRQDRIGEVVAHLGKASVRIEK